MYSTCIECFNKKVKCEFCNKEFNRTYLSKHLKRCIINHDNKIINNIDAVINHNDDNNIIINHNDDNNIIINPNDDNNIIINHNDDNNNNNNDNIVFTGDQQSCNRTLIVGPSFCGKTHLLLNKLQLIRIYDKEKEIHIITRSPNQYQRCFAYENLAYEDFELEDIVRRRSRR